MKQRNMYDLSHFSNMIGAIGSLQGLTAIPVLPGDTIELLYEAHARLSPLRRQLIVDAQVDIFSFFIPYRHVYGQDWVDFIEQGMDESITFGSYTSSAECNCCGVGPLPAGTYPKWVFEGPIRCYNNYFRDPTDDAYIKALDWLATLSPGDGILEYGPLCCYLPRPWNTGIYNELSTADYRVALQGGEIDLLEVIKQKGLLKTEITRETFGQRYQDILRTVYGAHPNVETNERPELLMRSKSFLSGYDVDGTDATTLGSYAGKSQGVVRHYIPPRFFHEHGTIWVFALFRFPSISGAENHYLVRQPEPTYEDISGDPNIIATRPPVTCDPRDLHVASTLSDVGKIPFAQWYREHPHVTHDTMSDIAGYPFIGQNFSTINQAKYIEQHEYDDIFSSLQEKHWLTQGRFIVGAKRFVPDVKASIFAGVK